MGLTVTAEVNRITPPTQQNPTSIRRGKADIWMPLYIGDYLADTAELDAERSGCYLHWLMYYWRKGPLPDVKGDLTFMGKLRSTDAPAIAEALLAKFFSKEADGLWHQKRMGRFTHPILSVMQLPRQAAR